VLGQCPAATPTVIDIFEIFTFCRFLLFQGGYRPDILRISDDRFMGVLHPYPFLFGALYLLSPDCIQLCL